MSGPIANVIDLYQGNTVEDFAKAKAAGVLGVIHKATTGATGRDSQYAQRRHDATKAGLLWGAYHWGTAAPVDQQVANFLKTASPDHQTLVALDFESSPGNQMTLDMARTFLTQIDAKLGRKAVVYSRSLIISLLGDTKDPFFGAHRLWLPQYGNPHPTPQASWSTYWLWQYTDGTEKHPVGPSTVDGIPGNANGKVDCDYFPGTPEALKAQWAS